jgi:hypothetical protein
MKLKGKGAEATLELTPEELDEIIAALNERYEHTVDANDLKVWRTIVLCMLETEGFRGMSWDELQVWNREHGFA